MKPLQEYLDEVYPIEITQDAQGIYNATIQKILGCSAKEPPRKQLKQTPAINAPVC